jgi:dGTPase
MTASKMQRQPWRKRPYEDEQLKADKRSPFARDRDRLIHSPSFRRLQGKTQLLEVAEGDYHRTRLTHTLEAAQIGRGLVESSYFLKSIPKEIIDWIPSPKLMEAIAFAHDIGHPPFGHNGEAALNYMMREHGGFEGNAQSLRQLHHCETHIAVGFKVRPGLNLTRRVLLGIIKYPRSYTEARRGNNPTDPLSYVLIRKEDWKPPKCYYDDDVALFAWIVKHFPKEDREKFIEWQRPPTINEHGKTRHKTLDCTLLELADDIAYATHDFEDGIALGFIDQTKWEMALGRVPGQSDQKSKQSAADKARNGWEQWRASRRTSGVKVPSFNKLQDLLFAGGALRRKAISHLIGAFVHNVTLKEEPGFSHPLLRYRAVLSPELGTLLGIMKDVVHNEVVLSAELQTLEYRGRVMIMELFSALSSEPMLLLKDPQRTNYQKSRNEAERNRAVCDFIAGMTDAYATRFYERLFVPRSGSAFDKL